MPGDFSRTLFDPTKHYSGVLMQQGRVQLDADWNEQLAVQQYRTFTEAVDVIGACGAPKSGDGFYISVAPFQDDLLIDPGHFYIDGLLCDLNPAQMPVTFQQVANNQVVVPNLNLDGGTLAPGQWVQISAAQVSAPKIVQITNVDENALILTVDTDISAYQNAGAAFLQRVVTYGTQPNFPTPDFTPSSPPSSPLSTGAVVMNDGTYLVYLEAWQREVNALEDARIRENALGGPDTTERLQTVWQVKLLPVNSVPTPPGSAQDCAADFSEWDDVVAPMTGMLNARTVPPGTNQDPCLTLPSAGYQSLENQLYRIEIFQGGATSAQATFVWSRENGSVETSITAVDGIHLYLHDTGKDDVLGFAQNQWVEIVDRDDELQGAPRFLAQIVEQPDQTQNRITLSKTAANYANRTGLRLRRWDMTGSNLDNGIPIAPGWTDIESGIQVQFLDGTYDSRSFWQIPARSGTGEIEWPSYDVPNLHPVPQPPLGIKHNYCKLALLVVSNGNWVTYDCRKKFPSLTSICADDVCYTSRCEMPGVSTVQDALDQLCSAADLREHNKYLHGWGIVCGLEVVCGPDDVGKPHRHITVRAGRAIDCNGNDIIMKADPPPLDAIGMLAPTIAQTDGTWLMTSFSRGAAPDLVFIETVNPGTGTVEVHAASGKSKFQTFFQDTGSAFSPESDGTWLMADYDQDGIPDLVYIKTSNTDSGMVEVHIASGKSNYQTRILDTPTTFAPETDGTWLMADFDQDGIPDLVFIKTANTGTGTVEIHVASGNSVYKTRILEIGTTFAPETDGTWLLADFDQDGAPDLVFIKTANTDSGRVEVKIASGKSQYQTRILDTGTVFAPEIDGTWLMADFDQDGIPDLVFVKTANTASGYVELHIASGSSRYQTEIFGEQTAFAPHPIPDGEYCLVLDPQAPGNFRFVKYDPAWSSFKSFLTGSLLTDFFNDCIKVLSDFFTQQFTQQPGSTDLVSPAQKRFTTILINLFYAQYLNTDNGSFVFLSQAEHDILQAFYSGLRALLQSNTYCAQFDGARPFPAAYPFAELNIHTIFGRGAFSLKPAKTRMRVDPTGARAYTVGVDSAIDVYDLQKQEMGAELTFPTPGAVVQDVAFSPDGATLYVIANVNNADTAFTTATVNGMTHTWSGTIVVCNKILLTLATWTNAAGNTMVCSVAADGLYVFDPTNVSATPAPVANGGFAGFGHLVVDQSNNQAFATACSTGANASGVVDHFDEVVRVNLLDPAAAQFLYQLPQFVPGVTGNDTDDMVVVPANQLPAGAATGLLFITINVANQTDKFLITFASTGTANNPVVLPSDVGENTAVSMAYNQVTNFLMITLEDSYRIKLYSADKHTIFNYRHPVQVQPISIVFRNPTSSVYVWNDLSNTITVIPAAEIAPVDENGTPNQWPLTTLLQYRIQVIDAFLDLLGGVIQYLKDCFCDHLLIKCPECDESDQLFLACLSIRNNEVFKVCNFSKRKYVKSFPTVGYWLSLIPIVPMLHQVVEKICCAALPEYFGTLNAPQAAANVVANPATGAYTKPFSAGAVRSTLNLIRTSAFKSAMTTGLGKITGVAPIVRSFAAVPRIPPAVTPVSKITSADLVGQSVASAREKLSNANITVDTVLPYDNTQLATNLTKYATIPANLKPGSTVTLVANERGVVQYYAIGTPSASQEALNSAMGKISDLQTALVNLQATHAKERDAQQALIQDLQAHVQRISAVVKLPG